MIELPPETSLSLGARLEFVSQALASRPVANVLDIGCGTGEYLTAPLSERFPQARFWAVDSDASSIAYASKRFASLPNITWSSSIPADMRFDAIIASEVLEHVDDPIRMLDDLRRLMTPDSILVVTLPNGYGCHEIMSTLEASLQVSGIIPTLKKLLRRKPAPSHTGGTQDTLAVSPHINFLSHSRALAIFEDRGLSKHAYRGRMFLFNFIASMIIDRSPRLVRWNMRMGQRLPAALVADWMFVLKRQPADPACPPPPYRRTAYERMKLRLNCRRWNVPVKPDWLA